MYMQAQIKLYQLGHGSPLRCYIWILIHLWVSGLCFLLLVGISIFHDKKLYANIEEKRFKCMLMRMVQRLPSRSSLTLASEEINGNETLFLRFFAFLAEMELEIEAGRSRSVCQPDTRYPKSQSRSRKLRVPISSLADPRSASIWPGCNVSNPC